VIELRRRAAAILALVLGVGCALAIVGAGPPARAAPRTHVVCHRVRHGRHHRVTCAAAKRHRPKARPAPQPGKTTTTTTATPPVTAPPPVATTPSPPLLPSRVAVDEYEYSVVAGHQLVAAGRVELNVSNIGQDDHNLTISRDGAPIAQTPVLHPGDPATTISPQLAPGTYRLYCSLYDHDQLGMHATLVVQ
jgi:hypothetical protein